ncbi:sodium bicarbonate transporter-like protein 11 [Caerostris extrusa]|uniref:Sodium bicarbonate transporter-like protein 11 n=1 Tax=Caerostris extrusa TaxID=172846 RepID=A0AAV4SQZ8_CAEEX|nr:sodium bicarbonate transporter-like protein 11 [Caerostris extrusa]
MMVNYSLHRLALQNQSSRDVVWCNSSDPEGWLGPWIFPLHAWTQWSSASKFEADQSLRTLRWKSVDSRDDCPHHHYRSLLLSTLSTLNSTLPHFNNNYFSHACSEEGSTPSVEFPLWISNSTINETQGEVSLASAYQNHGRYWYDMQNKINEQTRIKGGIYTTADYNTLFCFYPETYNCELWPYLQASKREILADYALPVAVISMSFLGSFVFRDVATDQFRYTDNYPLTRAPVEELPWMASLAALGMGFALSLLFFHGPEYFSCNGQ